MSENRENKVIPVVTKFLAIILLMGIAIFLFQIAPYFRPPERYEKGVLRVVVDDKDVTNYITDEVFVEDGVVMMSADTAMKYFDNIFIYYDEKYDTAIITSEKMIGKIKLGENTITVNGEEQALKGTVKWIEQEYNEGETLTMKKSLYVPISSISDVTNVDVIFNEKVIATTPRGKSRAKITVALSEHKIKAYKNEIALTMGTIQKGETFYVFDTEGKADDEYLKIRDAKGNIGYYQYGKIDATAPVVSNQGTDLLKYQIHIDDIKYSLVWEYAQNYTPNRTGEAKIDGLRIISPTWMEIKNSSGDLRLTVDKEYIKWAKGQNYILWPTLKNDFISKEDMNILSTTMNDMVLRERLINNVVNVALTYGFDGINLDLENMYEKDKDVFSEFVREFAATLRRNGLTSSVDVTIAGGSSTYSLCYDRTAIGKVVDYVMLMTYDQYWQTSENAGPNASLAWVKSNIEEMLGYEGVDKDKLFLCVPFYSRRWIVDSETGKAIVSRTKAIQMDEANNYLKQYKDIAKWSEEDGQYYIEFDNHNGTITKIWVDNEDALKKKIELVNQYDLAGVAAWRWGYEDGNEVWNVIKNTMNEQ